MSAGSPDAALHDVAARALAQMRASGFEHAQVSATDTLLTEVNVQTNEASLWRSAHTRRLALMGLLQQRKAAIELGDFADDAIDRAVAAVKAEALAAPADEAHAVSSGEQIEIVQGPQAANPEVLAAKAGELMAFRARECPKLQLQEAHAAHRLSRSITLTSGGSRLWSTVGAYELNAMGCARDGAHASSINYASGRAHDLTQAAAADHFGIGSFMRDAERQIHARPLAQPFTGDVVLTPRALSSLLAWLHEQLGDGRILTHTSLMPERVGQRVASPLLTLESRFDAPGVTAISADGFVARPVTVLREGVLQSLLPSLYVSRRTGLAHVPTAATGWSVQPGPTPLAALIEGVQHGALVDRLSMGNPAANGAFSGVIKNSFLIDKGEVGQALSEVMMSGNVAQMLRDIVAISQERIDTGAERLPWVRIAGLSFS